MNQLDALVFCKAEPKAEFLHGTMDQQLLKHREIMKKKWKKDLKTFTNHQKFKTYWNDTLKLSQYKIVTMKERHIEEILTILCYSFSCLGGANNHSILMTSPNDSYLRFKCELEHALKTGLSFVILDKRNNNVVSLFYGFDFTDQPSYKGIPVSKKLSYIKEMHKYAGDNMDYIQKKFDYDLDKNVKYGDIFYAYQGAVRPDIKGKGFIVKSGLYPFFAGFVGFKHFIGDHVNPVTIKFGQSKTILPYWKFRVYDFRDWAFKDGTRMKDIIDDLALTYECSKEYVDLKRNNCKQGTGIFDYSMAREGFYNDLSEIDNWINVWEKVVECAMNMKKKKRSKL